MNGATFRAHRKWLQLTHEQCAELLDVNDSRTIRAWETGRSYIPEGVADEITSWAQRSYKSALDVMLEVMVTGRSELTMTTYRRPEDVPAFLDHDRVSYFAYRSTIASTLAALTADTPVDFRVVEYDPEDFRLWCEASNRKPCIETLGEWSKDTADAQEATRQDWLDEKNLGINDAGMN